jgi:peptidyl-prolyl cis-trans isomerase SurA
MTDLNRFFRPRLAALAAALALATIATGVGAQGSRTAAPRQGDYILAIVNQEAVTAGELEQRLARVRENAARAREALPPPAELRKQVLDSLIDERAQTTWARDSGTRIDEAELDRAVTNVALQNQLTLPQLRDRLRAEGVDYGRFRSNVRDRLLVERVREREVNERIKISDTEIDAQLDKMRSQAGASAQYNIAQILIGVPDGAGDAVVAERRAKAEAVLARVRSVQPFEAAAREVSEDANKAQGGVIGLRGADRLPDEFVAQVRNLKPGEVSPTLLRTGAGFHILKLVEKRDGGAFSVTQTRARHILLRPSPQLSEEAAIKRLAEFKRQVESGARTFEALARENSEDASAPGGGDLGWQSSGSFVPEFEEAMNALPVSGLSDPVVSRFGVHLIQVMERRQTTLDVRQQREQARNILREQKFEAEYLDWQRELRARAYVELREPPT